MNSMDFFLIFLFIIPSYVANAIPVVLGGGVPLDFNRFFFDKQRICGEGKTIRGFIAGVSAGTIVAGIMALYLPLPFFSSIPNQFLAGTMLALGTMLGDAIGSFIKRRFAIPHGRPFLLDTFLFVIVALLLAYPYTQRSFYEPHVIIFLVTLTLILHPLTNIFANKIGLKKVPW